MAFNTPTIDSNFLGMSQTAGASLGDTAPSLSDKNKQRGKKLKGSSGSFLIHSCKAA